MSKFFPQVWRIRCLEDMSEKTADLQLPVSDVKLDVWNNMKAAARNDEAGVYIGLTKIALGVHHAGISANCAKLASDRDARDFSAISFATAYAVDDAIDKLASAGEISSDDALEFRRLNAESAMDDIFGMLKESDWYKHPAVIGAGAGALVGGGLGAWGDDENRLRGGVFGAAGGAAVGGIGGAVFHDWRAANQLEADAIASSALKGKQETGAVDQRINNTYNQWLQAAQAHSPEAAQVLQANEAALKARFATGAEDIPAEVVGALGQHDPQLYPTLIQNRMNIFPPVGGNRSPKGAPGSGGRGNRP